MNRQKKDSIIAIVIVVAIFGVVGVYYGIKAHIQSVQANSQSQVSTTDSSDNSSNTDTDSTSTDDTSTDLNADTSTDTSTIDDATTPSTSGKLTSADGNLELESTEWSGNNVIGVIKNLSSTPYSYVEVDINIYDADGNQVDSTLTNITNLDGDGTWNFSAPVINPVAGETSKVVSIQGN